MKSAVVLLSVLLFFAALPKGEAIAQDASILNSNHRYLVRISISQCRI